MNSKSSEPLLAADVAARPIQRRNWVVGVGAAGAAVLAVKALPTAAPLAPVMAATKPLVTTGGGYQLTAHVQRYYDTTRA